jgi:hypothetical protein
LTFWGNKEAIKYAETNRTRFGQKEKAFLVFNVLNPFLVPFTCIKVIPPPLYNIDCTILKCLKSQIDKKALRQPTQ